MIVVLGAGESGIGAALLAKKKGYNVFVSDSGLIKEFYKKDLMNSGILWEEGSHNEQTILSAEMLIKSPGISEIELLVKARSKGIEVLSEIEFAYRFTNGKIIAVTGSNGKTTTASLIHHILKKAKLNVALAGNIGDSFSRCLADSDVDFWVLELSSFQLDDVSHFRPYIAVLLNISPDHLDRYQGEMENYVASKMRITENQTCEDHFVYWDEDRWVNKNLGQVKANKLPFGERAIMEGAYTDKKEIKINIHKDQFIMTIHELALQGKHNEYNSMAGGIAAKLLGITNDIIRDCLNDFETIEHRLESVIEVNGVNYINDSKATNVNAAWYALDSMNSPVVWICGGVDKGNDYEQLLPLVHDKVKAVVCLGLDNTKLIKSFGKIVDFIYDTNSMNDAIKAAYKIAEKGDTVLLSPACSSFDLFSSYEDRGQQFKEQIRLL